MVIGRCNNDGFVSRISSLDSRVVFTGYVHSLSEVLAECDAMFCPLASGAGIKVKVLEALVSGWPVVSNPIGFEGIPPEYITKGYDYTESGLEQCLRDIRISTSPSLIDPKLARKRFDYQLDAVVTDISGVL